MIRYLKEEYVFLRRISTIFIAILAAVVGIMLVIIVKGWPI